MTILFSNKVLYPPIWNPETVPSNQEPCEVLEILFQLALLFFINLQKSFDIGKSENHFASILGRQLAVTEEFTHME